MVTKSHAARYADSLRAAESEAIRQADEAHTDKADAASKLDNARQAVEDAEMAVAAIEDSWAQGDDEYSSSDREKAVADLTRAKAILDGLQRRASSTRAERITADRIIADAFSEMISEQYGPALNVCATFANDIPEPPSAALPMLVIRQSTPSVTLRDGRIVGSVEISYYRGSLYAALDPAAILEHANSLSRFHELGHENYGHVPSVNSVKRDNGTLCDTATFEFGRGSEPDQMGGYVPERVKLPAILDDVDTVFSHKRVIGDLWSAFADEINNGNLRPSNVSVSGMTVKADEVRQDGLRHIVSKSLVSLNSNVQTGGSMTGEWARRHAQDLTMRQIMARLPERDGLFVPGLGHVVDFKYEIRSDRSAVITVETVSLPA